MTGLVSPNFIFDNIQHSKVRVGLKDFDVLWSKKKRLLATNNKWAKILFNVNKP